MTVTSRLLRPITLLFLLASVNLTPQFARGEWQAHHIRQGDGKGGWATRSNIRLKTNTECGCMGLHQESLASIWFLCLHEVRNQDNFDCSNRGGILELERLTGKTDLRDSQT
jgi:hypothetical protein